MNQSSSGGGEDFLCFYSQPYYTYPWIFFSPLLFMGFNLKVEWVLLVKMSTFPLFLDRVLDEDAPPPPIVNHLFEWKV